MVSMDPKEIAIPESIIISLIIVILLSVISSAAEKSIGQVHSSCIIPICAIYILYDFFFFSINQNSLAFVQFRTKFDPLY